MPAQGRDPLIDVAVELEKRARADDYFVKRNLYPNVDFYSGAHVLRHAGSLLWASASLQCVCYDFAAPEVPKSTALRLGCSSSIKFGFAALHFLL